MGLPSTAADRLVGIGRQLYERGLVAGSEGNLSVRTEPERILVTPSGLCKGKLTPEDLVTVDDSGQRVAGGRKASSELAMHLTCYQRRSDVGACVHAHPPYATAFALAGIPLEEDSLPEAVVILGPIALTEYAPAGTAAVPESLVPFLESSDTFLLRNHGALTLGRTIEEAANRMEMLEQYARINFLARQLGSIGKLPTDEVERLRQVRIGLKAES